MKLHLDYTPAPATFEITHKHRLLLSGSCFSQNIGALLTAHRFNTLCNPHGVLFNPHSLADSLRQLLNAGAPDTNLFLQRGNRHYSYLCHSAVQGANHELLAETLQAINLEGQNFLKSADVLVITFGSAYAYRHKLLDVIVGNCHKQAPALFEKELLSTAHIVQHYTALVAELQNFNPELKIIFTVSPVKHLRDGLVENTLSKATLLLAVHQLVKQCRACYYFPAYELVTDDLRDYRFYKEDLAHPTEQAIHYVWEKFSTCFFGEKTLRANARIAQLNRALQHKGSGNNPAEEAKLKQHLEQLTLEINTLLA